MGVNDLIKSWKTGEISGEKNSLKEGHDAAIDRCGNQLEIVADLCWNPVSEPPAEADGDEHELVAWRDPQRKRVEMCHWWNIAEDPDLYAGFQWARIRDVVLLPPEEQE